MCKIFLCKGTFFEMRPALSCVYMYVQDYQSDCNVLNYYCHLRYINIYNGYDASAANVETVVVDCDNGYHVDKQTYYEKKKRRNV